MPDPHPRAVIHILNFIRSCDHRDPANDLLDTFDKEVALVDEFSLPATWLLQYDALIHPDFRERALRLHSRHEVGLWLEIVQPLAERAGIPWRGRTPWDWTSDVTFTIGYTPDERRALVDAAMADFHATFGVYPKSVGSWYIDGPTLAYLSERYGVIGSCNCKDQWGTDNYSLWGGYYSQAYYPSRRNGFLPAQRVEEQVPIPVFRMLGSDPIYQYDIESTENGQWVSDLEPAYEAGGGNRDWTRWFFDVSFRAPRLSFGYAQTGQENSFRWELIAKGMRLQCELIRDMAARGELRVETLGASAAWYRSRYEMTPASAITALSDWTGGRRRSVWYCCRRFRSNLFWDDGAFRVRDIHLFDDRYAERYLTEPCRTPGFVADALPICDGYRWARDGRKPGWRLCADASETAGSDALPPALVCDDPVVEEVDDDSLRIAWTTREGVAIEVACTPEGLVFSGRDGGWALVFDAGAGWGDPVICREGTLLRYTYEGFAYEMRVAEGELADAPGRRGTLIAAPAGGRIAFSFA